MRRTVPVAVLLVAVVAALYWPVTHYGFINCDDPMYVSENLHVQRGLCWESIRWAFTTLDGGFWHPLTWLSLLADFQLFGLNAGGFHLTNLVLHGAATVLLFLALQRMTGALWRSSAVALLFAVHPLHVESVAWIADRKDLLSTVFCLGSLLMYSRYAEAAPARARAQPSQEVRISSGARWHYVLALVLFAASLMSKATTVTMPLVLLLLDWWPLGRLRPADLRLRSALLRRLLWEKIPFLSLGILSALVALHGQRGLGALGTTTQFPLQDRLANMLLSYVQYAAQTLWPARLAVFYPYPEAFPVWRVSAAALGLLGASVAVWLAGRKRPYLLVGWLWYLVTLLPSIGLVQVGGHARADRFMYLPLVGLCLPCVWLVHEVAWGGRYRRGVAAVLGIVALCGCAAVTRHQLAFWKDSEALFRQAIAVTQNNALAHGDLGTALACEGRFEDANVQFREALRISPTYAQAHINLGNSLVATGHREEALEQFRAAVASKPDFAPGHFFLASALAMQLESADAREHFEQALRLDPDYAQAHTRLGNLLLQQGAAQEGLAHLFAAVKLRDDCEDGHFYLAGALERLGRMEEAALHFRAALRAKPDKVAALNDLAWILATEHSPAVRDVAESLKLASRACECTGYTNAAYLDTLGVAFAEAGRKPEAIAATERAIALATASGQKNLSDQLRVHVESYRMGSPK